MRAPPVLIGGMVLDVQVRDSAVLMPFHQSLQLQHQLVLCVAMSCVLRCRQPLMQVVTFSQVEQYLDMSS